MNTDVRKYKSKVLTEMDKKPTGTSDDKNKVKLRELEAKVERLTEQVNRISDMVEQIRKLTRRNEGQIDHLAHTRRK